MALEEVDARWIAEYLQTLKGTGQVLPVGTTGDMVRWDGTSWVSISSPDVTQVEAEAGTETALRTWSPERVKQAIAALGSGVDAKPAGFEITGSQNLSTTEATLVFDSEAFDPDANYALSSGEVTVTDAGYYLVSLNMPINDDGSGGATRSRAFAFIQRDQGSGTWIEPAPPIRGQDYQRETSGGGGLSAAGIISLSAGEVVRWRADVSDSTDVSTETGETAFFIHRIR